MVFSRFVFSQDLPTVRTTVPLVMFSASVTDQKGRPILGLHEQDFEVLDNGLSRKARVDSSDMAAAPVALVVLVQTSDFSNPALGKIQKVGAMILEAVAGAQSSAAVVTYDHQVDTRQAFTSDGDEIVNAFRTLPRTEEADTRLLDAVQLAIQMFHGRLKGERQSILILGQSRDRGSTAKLNEVLSQLGRSSITVYGMTYSAFLTAFTTKASEYQPAANGSYLEGINEAVRLRKTNTVAALVNATGGLEVGFATKSKLENNLIGLGREIHSRYSITFTPATGTPAKFHSVQVRVRNNDTAVIHVRPGYWTTAAE